jgi:hypothetical protein
MKELNGRRVVLSIRCRIFDLNWRVSDLDCGVLEWEGEIGYFQETLNP